MLEKFREYLSGLGKSKNTVATYLRHVGLYFRWCEDSFGREPTQLYRPNVLDYLCNAHTHGMEKYNHPDFQMILRTPNEEICRILNTLGLRVQRGERFYEGAYVTGIYEDCCIRLQEFEETGRKVLRVIIPDGNNIFPENPQCAYPYNLQLLETEELLREN